MKHYRSFEPIRRRTNQGSLLDFQNVMQNMLNWFSVIFFLMLVVPMPSLQEHLNQSEASQKKGYRDHVCESAYKDQLLMSQVLLNDGGVEECLELAEEYAKNMHQSLLEKMTINNHSFHGIAAERPRLANKRDSVVQLYWAT